MQKAPLISGQRVVPLLQETIDDRLVARNAILVDGPGNHELHMMEATVVGRQPVGRRHTFPSLPESRARETHYLEKESIFDCGIPRAGAGGLRWRRVSDGI